MIKFCSKCRKLDSSNSEFLLSRVDLDAAKLKLLLMIQSRNLSDEVSLYKNNSGFRKNNKQRRREEKLWKLDPFVDFDGLLKVGGRLKKSNYNTQTKHPIILPTKSCLAVQRLVEYEHKRIGHGGRVSTANAICSSGYWLISGNTQTRRIIFNCVMCRKYRGEAGKQKMAELPENRITEAAPFTHSGVDMFGPFHVKEGRKNHVRHVALFTCFSSRAVHLEATINLTTDSFILALRRFLARRGSVQSIRSDNGTNFVGADNECKKAYNEMDHQKINNFLVSESCDWVRWKRNPPEASHMGGVWERQIRTVRSVLQSLLDQHSNSLNDESFRTLLAEVEMYGGLSETFQNKNK